MLGESALLKESDMGEDPRKPGPGMCYVYTCGKYTCVFELLLAFPFVFHSSHVYLINHSSGGLNRELLKEVCAFMHFFYY